MITFAQAHVDIRSVLTWHPNHGQVSGSSQSCYPRAPSPWHALHLCCPYFLASYSSTCVRTALCTDNMADMMRAKIAHVRSGANTAWVPSPTAATLHALHYHQENVFDIRMNMTGQDDSLLEKMLNIPLLKDEKLTSEQIQRELDNNVQGILGYVVKWINQGVGCSKVPDINNVGLMEDRATLRISSQHIANWLLHKVVTKQQVENSMLTMAKLVDGQNEGDDEYISMTPDTSESVAFQAAHELIFKGKNQPNGYTEPLLHVKRQEFKKRAIQ